ncbi:MAG: hypothetical protein H7A33_04790 [Deltaproteobacteria bacterium]|nr:hypothetical protein [Deltaproteobacteria bacterium]
MKSWILVFTLLAFVMNFASCDQLTTLQDEVVGFFSKDDVPAKNKKSSRAKKAPTESERKKTTAKKNENPKEEPAANSQDDQPANHASLFLKESKSNSSKKNQQGALLIKRKIGGIAQNVFQASLGTYLHYPEYLAFYDDQLKEKARVTLTAEALLVQEQLETNADSQDINTKSYLVAVWQKGQILELFRRQINADNTQSMHLLKSFEVNGTPYLLDKQRMALMLPDKIQFIDLANLDKINVIKDLPVANAEQALLVNNTLFVSRAGHLDLINTSDLELKASIRLARPFIILGIHQKQLIVGYEDKPELFSQVQIITLSEQKDQIKDIGALKGLGLALKQVKWDAQSSLLVGREADSLLQNGPVRLYSLNENRFLRGALSENTRLETWGFSQGLLITVTNNHIQSLKISLNQDVIKRAKVIDESLLNQKDQAPLAQIGAEKLIKDEYTLVLEKSADQGSDARKVVLLNDDRFVLFELAPGGQSHRLYGTTDFQNPELVLQEPQHNRPQLYDQVLPTPFGLLLHNRQDDSISHLDVDFSRVQTLPIGSHQVISWDAFSTELGEIIAISEKRKTRNPNAPAYSVSFYAMTSPSQGRLVRKIDFSERAFVFHISTEQILIATGKDLHLYSWKDLSDTSNSEPEAIETVNLVGIDFNAQAALLSPNKDRILYFYRDKGEPKIALINLLNTNLRSTFHDISLSKEMFLGSQFLNQGNTLAIPSFEGLQFYDISKTLNPKLIKTWPGLTHDIDIYNQGQSLCAAQGILGVICGDLSL